MLTKILAALVVGLLRWLAQRRDLKESVRKGLALDAAKLAIQAQQWKLDNLIDLGDPLGDFEVLAAGAKPVSNRSPKAANAKPANEDRRRKSTNESK